MTEPTLIVPPSGAVTAHCLRLRPGDRLMSSLKQAASIILSRIPKEECGSCFIITAVGSLQNATIRVSIYFYACITFLSKLNTLTLYWYQLANASRMDGKDNDDNEIKHYNQRFEIIGLTGTFSRNDGCHVHISLSDSKGNAIGGHLIDGTISSQLAS